MRLQQAFQDLLLRVAEAYFNVLYAQDALTATEAEKAAVAGQLESAKRNFELGNATITDTYEAQARYDLVLAQELRLQNDLDVRRDVLAQILGSPAGALAELPPGVRLPSPQPARLNDWSTQAEASSLDVLRAQLQTRIAGRDIQIARSGHYPTVNLRATSGSASDAVMSNGSSAPGKPINNSVGVVLSIPLYSGGGVSSQVTERVQLEQKARHDFEAARRQAVQAARQHYGRDQRPGAHRRAGGRREIQPRLGRGQPHRLRSGRAHQPGRAQCPAAALCHPARSGAGALPRCCPGCG